MGKDELFLELKQVLLREVPNVVQKIKLNEGDKVCYISLLGTDYEPVLGLITLGIESYRNRMIEESGTDDKWYLWNSGEMPLNYQTSFEDQDQTFQLKQETLMNLFGNEKWEEFWEDCQTLRFEVANKLNTYNWSDIIPTSDDFVVYSDWESIDVSQGDLVKSLPQEKIEILVEKSLI